MPSIIIIRLGGLSASTVICVFHENSITVAFIKAADIVRHDRLLDIIIYTLSHLKYNAKQQKPNQTNRGRGSNRWVNKNVIRSVYSCMHEGRKQTNLHIRQNNADWHFIILGQVTTFENN